MTTDLNVITEARKAVDVALEKRGHVNILLAGRTGVGKSTLINAVFQGHFADTGSGRPVTKHTREIRKEGIPLGLLDTRGLELADYGATLQALRELIKERKARADPKEHIHTAWACIAEDSRRVEEAESELVEMLSDHMPVIAVITKASSDQGFRDEVQRLLPQAKNVVRVRAMEEVLDDGHVIPPSNLDRLVDLTMEVVPEGQRSAFAAAQKVSTNQRAKRARGAVALAATAAAAAGATPIPMTDAVLLVPIQLGMIASISATFGTDVNETFLSTIFTAFVGISGTTLVGRTVVANLFKLFPGAGSVIGGAINAATAAALTTALGEAYIVTLSRLVNRKHGEAPTPDEIINEFKKVLVERK